MTPAWCHSPEDASGVYALRVGHEGEADKLEGLFVRFLYTTASITNRQRTSESLRRFKEQHAGHSEFVLLCGSTC